MAVGDWNPEIAKQSMEAFPMTTLTTRLTEATEPTKGPTMNPDPLEVWKEAMTQWCYGMPNALWPSVGNDQAAAAIIAQHYAPLVAEVERLRGEVHRLTIDLQQHKDALAQVGEKS